MVKARDRIKRGCYKVRVDESSSALPRLFPGDMVRGQHPETKEWSLKGQVLEMVHRDRAVNVDLDEGVPRLFCKGRHEEGHHQDVPRPGRGGA